MAHLSIQLLGSFQVLIDGTPIKKLESDKVYALLAYLAVESDRPHRRDALVGLFWPDFTEESARHNLRQALFNLRQCLGDSSADPPYFLVTRDAIQFNRESDYSLDLTQFNQHFYACQDYLTDKVNAEYAAHFEEMVKRYQGDFLQQFFLEDSTEFEQWVLVQRENLHQRAMDAHSYLADYFEARDNFQAARQHVSSQLLLDPWREESHRQMMRLLALAGERSAALAQYETCKRVLAEELDVEPSLETRELYEQIRLGKVKPKSKPPLNTSFSQVKNLPVQLTPFIGREQELAQLGQLISDPQCKLITLVGPGGIGKTRLAIQAAEDFMDTFAHGVAFIPLAAVVSNVGVIPAIVKAMNISFYGASDPKAQLLSSFNEKHMLLILDNVEHLLTAEPGEENITQLLVDILQSTPGIKLLVTSREALNLQGEWLFEVEGMKFPETTQAAGFNEFDAVALFVQRARRASPSFTLNPQNQDKVLHICHMVEGMPLAIELATTWMRTLSLEEIAKEIEKNLDFLSASVRDMPERHRSMRAVFDYSWHMLSKEEQQVLCKLSVFRGGFQRQAAEQIAGATLSILSTLVSRTLLRTTSPGRYDLHELLRQYSADKLETDPGAKSAAQNQHCDFFLSFAETANKELQGRDQLEWLNRLEQEQDNLRKALECTVDSCSEESTCDELALKLASALRWYWRMRGHFHEGCDWFSKALRRFPQGRSATRASALLGYSLLLNGLGDLGAALAPAEESVSIHRELGLQDGLAEALLIEGLTLLWQGEGDAGQRHTREALAIYRNIGDRWGEAQALYRLGTYMEDFGGAIEGRVMLEESASILKSFDEKFLYTSVLLALSLVDLKLGNYPEAQKRFEASLEASREIKHPWGIADVLTNMGCLNRIRGDYAQAQSHFEEAFQVYREHGRNVWEIDVLCAMSENDIVQGNFKEAHSRLQMANTRLGNSKNNILHILVTYFRGLLAYYEGDLLEAADLLEKTVELAQTSHFKPDLARALVMLGRVKLKQGQLESAAQLMQRGLRVYWEISQKLGYAIAFEALASARLAQGKETQAVMLLSSADTLRKAMGAPLPPVDLVTNETAVAVCRTSIGEASFSEVWAKAAGEPIEKVVENVLEDDYAG